MSASQPTDLTLDRASKILKSYDDSIQLTNTEPLAELEELRNSLLLVASLSSSQNLGICADNFQQGFLTYVLPETDRRHLRKCWPAIKRLSPASRCMAFLYR